MSIESDLARWERKEDAALAAKSAKAEASRRAEEQLLADPEALVALMAEADWVASGVSLRELGEAYQEVAAMPQLKLARLLFKMVEQEAEAVGECYDAW